MLEEVFGVRISLVISMMLLLLVGAASAGNEGGVGGRLQIVSQKFGFPQLLLEPPVLPAGHTITSLRVWRSTSDLSKVRNSRRFPIAKIVVEPNQTTYSDFHAPQGVTLYYQLETRTSGGQTYWSNVQDFALPVPRPQAISDPRLLVDKSTYTLLVLDGETPVRIFPIALGANCVNRKLHFDRASTPEGDYRVAGIQPKATFYKAIDINFPNEVDKRRYKFHADSGLLPASFPHIGGEIQIHGHGIEENWTWGCIALRDKDMDWLFSQVDLYQGMDVRIVGYELRPEDLDLEEKLSYTEFRKVKEGLETLGYPVGRSAGEWYHALSLFQRDNRLPITGILDLTTQYYILQGSP